MKKRNGMKVTNQYDMTKIGENEIAKRKMAWRNEYLSMKGENINSSGKSSVISIRAKTENEKA